MPNRNAETGLRAAVSVTQMAKMVGLSRAAFYEHVRRGHFVAPMYQPGSLRRPVYTAEMQRQNLEVRATQLGVNGEYVLFYERQPREESERPGRRSRSEAPGGVASDLLRRLEGLGLQGLSESRVEQAVAECFPHGAAGVAEPEVLRVIYRQLRRTDRA
jgi:AcrR family transcriptional regulator